jgi:hypothetical protein
MFHILADARSAILMLHMRYTNLPEMHILTKVRSSILPEMQMFHILAAAR